MTTPFEHPELFNAPVLDGIPMRGLWKIASGAERGTPIQQVQSPQYAGAFSIVRIEELVTLEYRVQVITNEDYQWLQTMLAVLRQGQKIRPPKGPRTYKLEDPTIVHLEVRLVGVTKLTKLEHVGKGKHITTIGLAEWKKKIPFGGRRRRARRARSSRRSRESTLRSRLSINSWRPSRRLRRRRSSMQFGDVLLSTADVSIPEHGIWSARIRLADDVRLERGTRGRLELGGLVLEGTVVEGAPFVGFCDYLLVGGAGGWRGRVDARSYRADNGVQLAQVAQDLAAAAGEQVEVAQDRALGAAWTRAGGLASDALDQLAARWYVRADGVTVLGERAAGTVAAELHVQTFDPARRTAVVALADEDLGELVPGLSIAAAELALRIEHVRLVVTPERVFAEVGPHHERRLVDAVVARVLARQRFAGLWPYQVTEQVGARVSVRAEPLTEAAGLPDALLLDKAHGLGGVAEECQAEDLVLVGWRGLDPGAPYVAQYFSRPKVITIDASEAVRVGDAQHRRVAREQDPVRVDPALQGSPAVEGGGLLVANGVLSVVPPGTVGAVYLGGPITGGSDLLSTK